MKATGLSPTEKKASNQRQRISTFGRFACHKLGAEMVEMRHINRADERPPHCDLIRTYCVPIQIAAADPTVAGETRIIGATALLWETIEGRFLVTACHVWRDLWKLMQGMPKNVVMLVHDHGGILRIVYPILVDECEDLDLAIITFDGIRAYAPKGKAFLKNLQWPIAPVQPGEFIVGCGYPGDARIFRNGQFEQQILFWAFRNYSLSKSGNRLLLGGKPGSGKVEYFTRRKPKNWSLPGISGAPLFVLRDTIAWVGTVRSGTGRIATDLWIQATPSSFVLPNGHIAKPCPRNLPGECECGKFMSPLRKTIGGILKFV